jgi:predicted MFS family arabinose efflux permease
MSMLPSDTPVRLLGLFGFLAAFCEALAFYAASLYAYQLTGSVVAVSVLMTAVGVAEVAGSLLGGTLADRFDRKLVAACGALAAAALLAVLAVGASVAGLLTVMVLATVAASPIRPVIGAALPNLVVRGDLHYANGYVQALRNAAVTLAPVVAGLGVGLIGARGIFAVAAASQLAAVAVLAAIRGRFRGAAIASVSDSPLEGLRAIRRDPVLLVLVAAGALAWFTAANTQIADLPFAVHDLGIGETGYGVLVAIWGLGGIAGAMLAPRAMRRLGGTQAFALAMLLEGLTLAVVSIAPSAAIVAAVFVAGGILGGIGATADQVIVQERAPDGARGRVRAASDGIMSAAYALSLALGGLVVDVLGPRGTYLLGGIGVVTAGAMALTALRRMPAGEASW